MFNNKPYMHSAGLYCPLHIYCISIVLDLHTTALPAAAWAEGQRGGGVEGCMHSNIFFLLYAFVCICMHNC